MKRLLLIALCGALGACTGGDHEDLKQWMADNTIDSGFADPAVPGDIIEELKMMNVQVFEKNDRTNEIIE